MKNKDSSKLNILFLCSWYPDRINTTNGNFIVKHAQAVSKYCNVSVLHVCSDPNLEESFEIETLNNNDFTELIIYVKKTQGLKKIFSFYRAFQQGFNNITKKSGKINLIHLNVIMPAGIMALVWRLKKKTPYIITEHWTGYLHTNHYKISKIHQFVARAITKRAAFVIPVTKNLGLSMQKLKLNGKYKSIPNVVDTELFKPILLKNQIKFKFIHISTLKEEHKNVSGILRAIKSLSTYNKNIELHIISEGNQDKYKNYLNDISLPSKYVFFHGEKKVHEVAKIMGQCHALLLFSNYENLPCVIVEALACGIPTISTAVGGISEHIDKTRGILVEVGNERELLNAMKDMIDNYKKFDEQELREYAVNNFSYNVIGKSFYSIYQKTIK